MLQEHLWSAGSDQAVRVISAAAGNVIKTLEHHTGFVRCLSRVGSQVWTAASDKTIAVWGSSSVVEGLKQVASEAQAGHAEAQHELQKLQKDIELLDAKSRDMV